MPVLKYLSGGSYVPLPGGIEEVTISPNQPPVPTDLWLDTDDDTSYPDNILSGWRNVLRNGDMSVGQRGDGPWTTNGYGIDGWFREASGGTVTVTRTTAPQGSGPGQYLHLVVSGQSAATDYAVVLQHTENVEVLSGKTVTLSFDAVAASGAPKIGVEVQQSFGSGGSASVNTAMGAVAISTTRTRYSLTFTVPAISGKTIGTGSALGILFWFSAGTNNAVRSSGIGIQANTFDITDVQLEAGAIATPFERIPIQQQLAWCQRFYYRIGGAPGNGYGFVGVGLSLGSTSCRIAGTLPTPLRGFPTLALVGTMGLNVGGNGGVSSPNVTGLSVVYLSLAAPSRFFLDVTTPTVPIGFPVHGYISNSTGSYLEFVAEQ